LLTQIFKLCQAESLTIPQHGTGTLNMPNHHPVAIGSNTAVLDQLLVDRFILVSAQAPCPRMPKPLLILARYA
jgi:hypothetical protein